MKIRVNGYIEGRTETMISEGDLDFQRIVRPDSQWAGYPEGLQISMRTKKKNTLYDDNECIVEFIFDKNDEEYKWIEELIGIAKIRANWLKHRFRRR